MGGHVTQQSQSRPFSGIALLMLVLLQLQSWGCQGPCSLSGGKKEASLQREAERGPQERWGERKGAEGVGFF
ncbi:hypothetical protein Cadr_000021330 [Camelus dromedarius]|uniref:Uncharacterized protein n=1 Tax=Camelus dromedarius TaxID=9838 RepID=A0A5N4CTU2_CAMDR|nr:hypothetical protein Cadr_000021330 [Camelus dromedarius]